MTLTNKFDKIVSMVSEYQLCVLKIIINRYNGKENDYGRYKEISANKRRNRKKQ